MELFFYILINIIVTLFVTYLVTYFKEKGQNRATKEDIAEITKKIEEVKSVFIQDTEKLKAHLNLLTSVKFSLHNEERKAIIDYNKKYYIWFNSITNISFQDFNIFNNNEIDNHIKTITNYNKNIADSTADFQLFVSNRTLVHLAITLQHETRQSLGREVYTYLLGLQKNNYKIELLKEKNPTFSETDEYKELIRLRKEKGAELRKNNLKHYEIIYAMYTNFRIKCREYLYQH